MIRSNTRIEMPTFNKKIQPSKINAFYFFKQFPFSNPCKNIVYIFTYFLFILWALGRAHYPHPYQTIPCEQIFLSLIVYFYLEVKGLLAYLLHFSFLIVLIKPSHVNKSFFLLLCIFI
jgi:hypothetical protein